MSQRPNFHKTERNILRNIEISVTDVNQRLIFARITIGYTNLVFSAIPLIK